ncbi:hypothetical protein HPB50_024840 [Hyalomma asiaticum]|uniref:Uncharacterized protein n=1 Tax=Hyalomma asiaticum TaxID=266040 RepID=A0ACB7RRS0_HYAAI|nr:hypothetical protein HPB50_024840 [Hyalomma asiaticum]
MMGPSRRQARGSSSPSPDALARPESLGSPVLEVPHLERPDAALADFRGAVYSCKSPVTGRLLGSWDPLVRLNVVGEALRTRDVENAVAGKGYAAIHPTLTVGMYGTSNDDWSATLKR